MAAAAAAAASAAQKKRSVRGSVRFFPPRQKLPQISTADTGHTLLRRPDQKHRGEPGHSFYRDATRIFASRSTFILYITTISVQGHGTDPATTYHETHSHRHSHAAHSPIRVARWTNTRPLTDGLNDPEPPDKPLQPQYHTKHGGGCLAYVWLCRTPYMSSVSKHPSQTPTQHSEEWHVLRLPAAILAEALLRVLS